MRKHKYITIALLTTLIGTTIVRAENIESLQEQKTQLESQANSISSEISEKDEYISALQSTREQLEADVASMQQRISELMAQMDQQEATLAETTQHLEQLEGDIQRLKEIIEARTELLRNQARAVQTSGGTGEIISMLLESENLSDLFNRITVITTIMTANKETIDTQKQDQEALVQKQLEAQQEYEKQLAIKQELEVVKSNVIAQKAEADDKINQIIENVALSEQEKAELTLRQQEIASQTSVLNSAIQAEESRQRATQAELERAAAARQAGLASASASEQDAARQAASQNVASSTGTTAGRMTSSGFISPATGYYSSYFGWRSDPFGGSSTEWHTGLDIAGSGNILAAQSGTVETAGYGGGYGYYVVVNHGNGLKTLYAHLQPNLAVAAGQQVSQGQVLGIMGTTGRSTGVHLHFEVIVNGSQVDPLPYLN